MNSNGTLTGEYPSAAHGQKRRVWIRVALSYALALACLIWVFHDYDFGDLRRRVVTMNLSFMLIAIISDALSYVCQGLRWRWLMRPFGSVSVLRSTQAIYSGMFVNEILPLKLGELLRGYLISRWTSVKLSTVATSIVVERLFDGFWLATAFVVTMIFVPLPRRLMEAGDALSAMVLILICLLIAISLRAASPALAANESSCSTFANDVKKEGETRNQVGHLMGSFRALVNRLAVELRVIVHSRTSLAAFALSLLVLSLQWLAFWLAMLAFGLHLSLGAAAAVFVIVHVGASMPGAPANLGTYQFFTVLGLVVFGVDKTSAAGFSVVVFILLSTHIWILGFWALRSSGLTLFGMRNELSKPLPELK